MVHNMIYGLQSTRDQRYCQKLYHIKLTCFDISLAFFEWQLQRKQRLEHLCLALSLIVTLFNLQLVYSNY
jgi:hypothetical protein